MFKKQGCGLHQGKTEYKTFWSSSAAILYPIPALRTAYTVNTDCVKFEYVVLAKYHNMLIFEFDLLTKQQILILCKKLL